jgi:riboflavin kinase / FMN adenylyltransferase
MRVLEGAHSLPLPAGPSAVTVGFFDGVHLGHQAVLRHTVDVAEGRGLTPVVVTFDRHPREILSPGREPPLLTTLRRKTDLIAGTGVQAMSVLEFTEEFSRWPAERFVDQVLVRGVRAAHVVVGSNFTFGHRAEGNLPMLADLGAAGGFSVEGVALLRVQDRPVSSSSIREALTLGDLDWPTTALGRRYVVDGVVTTGAGRGTDLGYPTANLEVPSRMLLPADGVYAGKAIVEDGSRVAAINVGTNPTFGREPRHVEAYLLDFHGDLSGRPMAVEFWARLREETRFESAEALVRQIDADVERTRELVS